MSATALEIPSTSYPTHLITSLHPSNPPLYSKKKKFTASFAVLSLGLSVAASPIPSRPDTAELAARSTVPNTSVIPLTLEAVFQTLKEVIVGVAPTLAGPSGKLDTASVVLLVENLTTALNTASAALASNPAGDMGATDQDLATLIQNVLDDLNTALNTLVPKLGLDGILSPLDTAIAGLLTSLNASLVPGLLAALRPLLVGQTPLPAPSVIKALV
ncbi:hypothetical protein K438DRAFT_1765080 [Mycena galopus ATCC 62051]|nr:hypothetical protein K438DRAFT_1765080 [Mycena galopus ATCC 62051]